MVSFYIDAIFAIILFGVGLYGVTSKSDFLKIFFSPIEKKKMLKKSYFITIILCRCSFLFIFLGRHYGKTKKQQNETLRF